jgi:hypothetical protein
VLRVIGVLVALLTLPAAGAAAAAGSLSFSAPARIDRPAGPQAPAVTGLSCVSERLCYGVDAAGDVVRFSGRIATGGGQTLYGADPGGGFVGLSCPSARLCVGIDTNGRRVRRQYLGARLQRRLPERSIRRLPGLIACLVAARYIQTGVQPPPARPTPHAVTR